MLGFVLKKLWFYLDSKIVVAILILQLYSAFGIIILSFTVMSSHRLYKFFAFISYSRKDAAFAEKVQSFLEHFKLPSKLCRQYPDKPKNLRPIYRDKTDLAIDNLKDALQIGLENSKYLIVICSEHSAAPNDKGVNWIDREIRQFVEIDPENVRRIIPILYRTKNSPRATECLPPAIKELGILAADIQDKGEKRVLSDVVAKMLNLQPDELWDRWTKAIKRKRRIIASSAAVILSGAGLFAWDFCVPKVSYYTDYVECNNIPQGIGELSESDIANRHYYRFTNQFYKLQTVETCTPSGHLTDGAPSAWDGDRPSKMVLEHDYLRNELLSIHHIDSRGKVLVTLRFPDDECITFNHTNSSGKDKGSAQAPIKNSSILSLMRADVQKTEIKRKSVKRDEKGYIITQYFQNEGGKPRKDAEGVYGHRYTRDSKGRIVSVRYLSKHGKDMLSNKGVAGYDVKWGDNDLVDSITNVDLKGRPALCDDHYAGYSFDWKDGNIIQLRFEDIEGKPCIVKQGFAAIRLEYNEKHQPAKMTFVDENGNACVNSRLGVLSMKLFYDNKDRPTKMLYLDKEGNLSAIFGCAGEQYELDERGNRIKTVYLGVDEKPCVFPMEKIAGYCSVYDDDYREVKRTHIDVNGKPCLNDEGIAGYCSEFDDHGNEIRRSYFGVDGELCLSVDKIAGYESDFDDKGNEIKRSYFGVDGEPCLNNELVAGYYSEWTEHPYERKDSYFDVKGNPCSNNCGISQKITKYNDAGLDDDIIEVNDKGEIRYRTLISLDGFDGDKDILSCRHEYDDKGNVVIKGYVDKNGNLVKLLYLGPDGKPCLTEEGCAGFILKYDNQGKVKESLLLNEQEQVFTVRSFDDQDNITKEVYVDSDGNPCMNEDGYAGILAEYDDKCREIKRKYIGVDGKLCVAASGFAGGMTEYDEQGNVTTISLLNEKEQICLVRHLDEKGNIVKELNIGPDGKPCLNENGIAGYEAEYDATGKEVKRLFIGVDGKLCVAAIGFAGYLNEYDGNGQVTTISLLNEKEQICLVRHLDEKGNIVKELNIGPDGKPCLNEQGIAGYEAEYDATGKEVKLLYIGVDGKHCVDISGFVGYLSEYDEQGKVIAISLLNEQGQTIEKRYLDANGNVVKRSYIDSAGNPRLNEDGAAGHLAEYDENNRIKVMYALDEQERIIEAQYWDEQGNLVQILKVNRRFDEKGNIVEERYVDPDGKPCLSEDGTAGYNAEYDEKGNLLKLICTGLDGKPCMSTNGFAGVIREYDETGKAKIVHLLNEKEQIFMIRHLNDNGNTVKEMNIGSDGKPCLGEDGVALCFAEYDAQGRMSKVSFFGINEEPCVNQAGHHGYLFTYDAAGNCTRMPFDLNGKVIETEPAHQ